MVSRALGILLGVVVSVAIVVGVVITWFGFFPAVGIISDVELEIVSEAGHTIWDSDERLAMVEVARGNDSIEIVGFNLIFVFGDEEVRHFVDGDLDANSAEIYYVDLSNYSGELEEILLAPVFVGGEEGKVSSRLKVNDRWSFKNVSEIEGVVVPVSSGSSSGGGSSGGGSSSDGEISVGCTNDIGCLSNGSFCDVNTPYSCNLGDDGCLDRVDGVDCGIDTCQGGICTTNICGGINVCGDYNNSVNCNSDFCNLGGFGCDWNFGFNVCESETNNITYIITTNANTGGNVSPSGAVTVNTGEDITFTITPDSGYVVANIQSEVSLGAAPTFTFYRVNRDYDMNVFFLPEANQISEVIYVDNSLALDCLAGEYSVTDRNNLGNDGNAYTSIKEAANVAGPGDTVLIRAGTYHAGGNIDNDVLWPKHSGTQEDPIVFRSYNGEEVILGDDESSYPGDYSSSIARGMITLKNVNHIQIEGLTIRNLAGWIYGRNCSYITIKNNWFENAQYGSKGGARFFECNNVKIVNNTFRKSSYDSLRLDMSDYNLIENNTFAIGKHSLLTLKGASYNVIRGNGFTNSYKLTEVYDRKVQAVYSISPTYFRVPGYDRTQHNVFEDNHFGFMTSASAIQFSGQKTIIRNNIFSNPVNVTPPVDYPGETVGGRAISMRWGGSWEGWDGYKLVGHGHEAGFVYGNRIYNNVFHGYSSGKTMIPSDSSVDNLPNPPPMEYVEDYQNYPFSKKYAFEDNRFLNNVFSEGRIDPFIISDTTEGKPVQLIIRVSPLLMQTTYVSFNNLYAAAVGSDEGGPYSDQLVYDHPNYPYDYPNPPSTLNSDYSTCSGNIQRDPLFADSENDDFHLQPASPMIDVGRFLTSAVGSGSGFNIVVDDTGYFYDGYNIEGEVGDLIQLDGQVVTARIIDIDYATNTLTLDTSLSWIDGQGVGLSYSGSGPDIGAYEFVA